MQRVGGTARLLRMATHAVLALRTATKAWQQQQHAAQQCRTLTKGPHLQGPVPCNKPSMQYICVHARAS
jgi:hypothetical protein